MNAKFKTLFVLTILMVAILLTGCGALSGGDADLSVDDQVATNVAKAVATITPTSTKDLSVSERTKATLAALTQTATNTPQAKVPTSTPRPKATSTLRPKNTAIPPTKTLAPEKTESWHRITVSKFFDIFGKWELPLGTFFATDTSKGRYTAVESAPAGPQADGSDAGWCKSNQYGCQPHTFLYNVEVLSGTNAIMDIPTRLMMDSSKDGGLQLRLRFNDETRSPAELMADYKAAASGGDLGLFIAIKDPSMQPAILEYLGSEFKVGYACWDCLAHTAGQKNNIVSLENVTQFGQNTPSQGDSIFPGYVIPIPSPDEDPDFEIDLKALFPEGTKPVVWLGRYDAE